MSNRLERNEIHLKKRSMKSPVAASAAETILLLTKHGEKTDSDVQVSSNLFTTRRNNSEMFLKGLKRNQSMEYVKVLNEKNQEIKKLQQENNNLTTQLNELTGTVKKYHKMRSALNEKDLIIESLKGEAKTLKKSIKKKKPIRISSKVSFDNELISHQLTARPSSAAFKRLFKNSPEREDIKVPDIPESLKKLLVQTEKTLKGWKKSYKSKNKLMTKHKP